MSPRARRGEQGSAAIEAAVGVPAFMLFVALIIIAGRVAIATQAVQASASEAARVASITRTQQAAGSAAKSAAASSLTNQGVRCVRTTIVVDTTGFASPVGTPASIDARISCTVNLSDLSLPGIPGTKTVSATASSPLDTYRERAEKP